jgi:hypothetical protein
MGFLVLSISQETKLIKMNWLDYTMHPCANPPDASIPILQVIQRTCDGPDETENEHPEKVEIPRFLVNGELETPRAKRILSYFQNASLIS